MISDIKGVHKLTAEIIGFILKDRFMVKNHSNTLSPLLHQGRKQYHYNELYVQ